MALGTLYLVPNLLGVVAPDAVLPHATIARARALRHFAVETPKAARTFLSTLELGIPIASLAIEEMPQTATIESWLLGGSDVGVVSDAGCPGTADPGAALVALAHRIGARVVPLVGPSALLLTVMASGMNGQQFRFHGYLSTERDERVKQLKSLENAVVATGETQLFIETPYRNGAMLDAIFSSAQRVDLCVAQNLTLDTQRIVSKPVAKWTAQDAEPFRVKAPAVFALGRLQKS
jgi:16S rRNA (cytidine1402-2'-O)-methyltransferase